MTLVVGDEVKLSPKFARSITTRTGRGIKWEDRRGRIAYITANKSSAGVKWTDRKSIDSFPIAALERV